MSNQPKEPQAPRDVSQIIRFLSHAFNNATKTLDRANRSPSGEMNLAYKLQTEFAYLLNEIAMCPPCTIQKHIAECNEFLDETLQMMNRRRSLGV